MPWTDSRSHPSRSGPVIDMTPEGEFVDVHRENFPPLSTRIVGAAVIVAVIAGGLGIAALALWLAFTLIPLAIAGAVIAYGVFRVQLWWARRGSLGGQRRDLFRP